MSSSKELIPSANKRQDGGRRVARSTEFRVKGAFDRAKQMKPFLAFTRNAKTRHDDTFSGFSGLIRVKNIKIKNNGSRLLSCNDI